ncbi:MAG: hypothetical protein IPL27_23550 [Lewinellaceae bacterium]|nr:hypothetical protein [Lewinellaceae bacterium]
MTTLFDSVKDEVVSIWQNGGVPAADIQRVLDFYESTIPNINLFWVLRTLPIGISSLMLPHSASVTPLEILPLCRSTRSIFPAGYSC